jgi:hypothetical protein
MALIDELRAMMGASPSQDDEEEDRIAAMLAAEAPAPMPQLDPAVLEATTGSDMAQPIDMGGGGGGGSQLGHPDVLNYVKELESSGALSGPKQAEAPKGMRMESQTVKGETGGIPTDVLAQGVAVRGQEQLDNAQVDRERLIKEAEEMEKRAAYLRMDADIETEKRQKQEAEVAAKQERLRAQQMELAGQADEPINPDRYFDNKSIVGKAFAVISAGIYGYLGGQGQPPVVQSLMQMAKEDVAAQMADNAANRGRRSSLIAQYESQYQDAALVAKRLEADKLLTFAKKARAEGFDAKSMEVRAQAEDLAKKLENSVGRIHQEIQEATFGKPLETSTTFKAIAPKGSGDPNKQLKEALEMDALLEKRGYTREERSAMLQAAKLAPPGGKTEAELKREDEATKRAELTPEQQRDARDRIDGLASARQGFMEFDAAAGFSRDAGSGEVKEGGGERAEKILPGSATQLVEAVGGAIPWGIGDDLKNYAQSQQGEDLKSLRRSVDKITAGMAKANSGAGVSDKEYARYAARLPITGAESLRKASAELFREQRQEYRNAVGQYGKDRIDEMLEKRGIDPSIYGSL